MTVATAPPAEGDDRDRKAALIGEFRQIVASKQGATIDGFAVDRFSAAQVVAMHDRLSPDAQKLYVKQGVERMVVLAYMHLHHDLKVRSRRR
jgi:hypothetical protein